MAGKARSLLPILLLALACGSGEPTPELAENAQPLSVGGCSCVEVGSCADLSYSDVPENGLYVLATFGGPGGGTMSCGGVADGTWAYAAGRARFGCGTKLAVMKNGKSCVAEVADCGPNRCVEQAASYSSCGSHTPTLGVSPLIASHLIGVGSAGWSEQIFVAASIVDDSSIVGCPGLIVQAGAGGAGGAGAGGESGAAGAGSECAAPICACGSCFEDCLCDTGDTEFCAESCALEPSGAAGSSSQPDPASSGCSGAPDCGGCAGCYDACRCQYKSVAACMQQCGKSDSTTPAKEEPPVPSPQLPGERAACAAQIAGAPVGELGTPWLALAALIAGLVLETRRAGRHPGGRRRRSGSSSRAPRAAAVG
jgi:hypothetical protein